MAYGLAHQRLREVCRDSPGYVVVPEIVQPGLGRQLRGGPHSAPRVLNGVTRLMVSGGEDAGEGLRRGCSLPERRQQRRGGAVERDLPRAGLGRTEPEAHPGEIDLSPGEARNLPAARP